MAPEFYNWEIIKTLTDYQITHVCKFGVQKLANT